MNLAVNHGIEILFIVFEVMFKNNRQHAEHNPAYSANCYCVIESRLEIIHGCLAKQIITCTVTA